MNKDKILLADGIIDFYVDKKKYLGYKTNRGRFNYVYTLLAEILGNLIGKTVDNVELRNLTITSNNFWGIEEFCIINDIGYSCNNPLPLNDNYITLRIFHIDLVGLVKFDFNELDGFITIKNDDYQIDMSSVKLC